MLDIKFVRENPDAVKENIKKKFQDAKLPLVDEVVEKDAKYRECLKEVESLKAARNKLSKANGPLFGQLKKCTDEAQKAELQKQIDANNAAVKADADKMAELEAEEATLAARIQEIMYSIPQMIDPSVPIGPDDTYNVEAQRFGEPVVPDFPIPYHTEIMESFDGIDMDAAGRVAGNGFYYLLGNIARLHEAVLAYARDFMIDKGFTYVIPPFMMHGNVVQGVMSFPEMDAMMYKIEGEDLYLIGTSEHTMIGRFIDQTLDEATLPLTLTSYSPCFRKEKGAHGIEERGIYRIHQFEKQQKNQGIPHPVPFARRCCRCIRLRLVRQALRRQGICRDGPAILLPDCSRRLRQTGSRPADHIQQPQSRRICIGHRAHPAAFPAAQKQHRVLGALQTSGCKVCTHKALRCPHTGKLCRHRPALDPADLCAQLFPRLCIGIAHGSKIKHFFCAGHRFHPGFQQSACIRITAYQQPVVRFQRLHRCMNKGHLPFSVQLCRKAVCQRFLRLAQCRGRFCLQRSQCFCTAAAALGSKSCLLHCLLYCPQRCAKQPQHTGGLRFFFVYQLLHPRGPGPLVLTLEEGAVQCRQSHSIVPGTFCQCLCICRNFALPFWMT